MTNYIVSETTTDGKRYAVSKNITADSYDDAVKKYFQQHSDPGSIRCLDVWSHDEMIHKPYNLSELEDVDMSD